MFIIKSFNNISKRVEHNYNNTYIKLLYLIKLLYSFIYIYIIKAIITYSYVSCSYIAYSTSALRGYEELVILKT